ncbi:MAG: hypothetical protein HY696_09470 [Deltaproteobacteria bacterium]|nr:hypothetical protein [Deltaproteobacteria bacterium]
MGQAAYASGKRRGEGRFSVALFRSGEVNPFWDSPQTVLIPQPRATPRARSAVIDRSPAAERAVSAYLLPLLAEAVTLCTPDLSRDFPGTAHFRRDFETLRACFSGPAPYAVELTARAVSTTTHSLRIEHVAIDAGARTVRVAITVDAREMPPLEEKRGHPMALWRSLRPGHLLYLLWAALHFGAGSPETAVRLADLTGPPRRTSYTTGALLQRCGRLGSTTTELAGPSPLAELQTALLEGTIPRELPSVMQAAGYTAPDIATVRRCIAAQPIEFYVELADDDAIQPRGELSATLLAAHRIGVNNDRLLIHWRVGIELAGMVERHHLLLLVARGLLLYALRGDGAAGFDQWPERQIANINRLEFSGAVRVAQLDTTSTLPTGPWSAAWLKAAEQWWRVLHAAYERQQTRDPGLPATTASECLHEAIAALPAAERAALGIPAPWLHPLALTALEPLVALGRVPNVVLHHPTAARSGASGHRPNDGPITRVHGDGANRMHVTLAATAKGHTPPLSPLTLWAEVAAQHGSNASTGARLVALQRQWARAAEPLPEKFDIQGDVQHGVGASVTRVLQLLHAEAARNAATPAGAAFLAWCGNTRRFAITRLAQPSALGTHTTLLPAPGATYLLLNHAAPLTDPDWIWLLLAASLATGPITVARPQGEWRVTAGDSGLTARIAAILAQWRGSRKTARSPTSTFQPTANPHYRAAERDTKSAYAAALEWFRAHADGIDAALLPAACDDRTTVRSKRAAFLLRYHPDQLGGDAPPFSVGEAIEHWEAIFRIYPPKEKGAT